MSTEAHQDEVNKALLDALQLHAETVTILINTVKTHRQIMEAQTTVMQALENRVANLEGKPK